MWNKGASQIKRYKQLAIALGIMGILTGCGHSTSTNGGTASVMNSNSTNKTTPLNNSVSSESTSALLTQPITFTTLNMVDSNTGWATGQRTVWLTIGGGNNWKNVSPRGISTSSNEQIQVVYGLNNKQAWIALSDPSTVRNPVAIYHTTDGGQTWGEQKVSDVGDPMSLHFSDANHGWFALMQGVAMGSARETIYQTNNGGVTWNKVAVTNDVKGGVLPFGGDKTGVSFIDNNHGFATGFTHADGQIYLYQTTDDGKTWNNQTLSVPTAVQGAQFSSYPPMFFNQQGGILPVSFGSGLIAYRTTNGGKTWVPGKIIQSTVQNQAMQSWSFPTMNDGFATDGSKIFTTSDSGQSWSSFTPNLSLQNVLTLTFTSSTNGWALLSSGVFYRTTDGGHTWKKANMTQ